ncbi:ABC-type sugar transport system, permease component [Thermobacillus composti KWC4]|uniref:ABC-type sugar transport system, permease component n=1 Tax=Thermobacillus composti (strain DSM 18247 / JCM 13945 / KWC4) TaxID=717605 RepID=L0EGF0_THECK|nr:carbohydrate ABC transporter permease [Thermobacillus composti]AGA58852.1 ABC-type sugar transport system, permease component [Thermobacillus composti KWC4]
MQHRQKLLHAVLYALMTLSLLWALVPILHMILSSMKTQVNMFEMPPRLFFTPTFDVYEEMFFGRGDFPQFLRNSLVVSVVTTALCLLLGVMGGFGLARGNFRWEKDVSFWVISTRMAPIPAVILPLYLIFSKLNLIGTTTGLVLAYTTFNLPFALWMMSTFFKDVPADLEEAAMIDGCGKFRAFWRVVVPAAAPGIVATAVLCLMFSWNDYLFASIFTGRGTQTVPIAASLLVSQSGIKWGQAMATGTVIIMPMLICGLLVRKYMVRGLSMGAVK